MKIALTFTYVFSNQVNAVTIRLSAGHQNQVPCCRLTNIIFKNNSMSFADGNIHLHRPTNYNS